MNDKHNKKLSFHHDRKHVKNISYAHVSFCYYQAAEEAAEADTATEPPGTLLVGQPFVMSITVLQAQGIPVPYTDVFCQIR